MDGFVDLFASLAQEAGVDASDIHRKRRVELPGFFRPTKEWDLLVVARGRLVAVIEAKSHVGPSFGNNFNNRTEEAMGSALDLWTAYREGAFQSSVRPWLGYCLILEECARSSSPVKPKEPHFPVFPEFKTASYIGRYELFCRRLIRERHYDAAVFLTSQSERGNVNGNYREPGQDLTIEVFTRSLVSHIRAQCGRGKS